MFKRILTATGTPDACEPALITALEIAKQNQGKLFILHVMEATYRHECGPQESVKDFKTGEAVAPTHEYKEAVKAELDKKCEGALKPFGNYEINVVEGRPGIEIRRWARKVGADLVVMGPHTERVEEEKELTGAPRGDTVEDVIAFMTSPVMIVNSIFQKERLAFKKILVCIDFSRSCEYACRFADKAGPEIRSKTFSLSYVVHASGRIQQGAVGQGNQCKQRKTCRILQNPARHRIRICGLGRNTPVFGHLENRP